MKPRPKRHDPEVFARARESLFAFLRNCPCMVYSEDTDIEAALKILSKESDLDGYKLAKRLEESSPFCECCLQDAEELDGLESILVKYHDDVVRDWVKAEKLVIPHKVGDTISFRWGNKEMTGVVQKLNFDLAELAVVVEGRNGKLIVLLENVKT
jgi:hypothetical protein